VTTVYTQKFADFNGRGRRSEYWFAYLALVLVSVVANIIGAVIGTNILTYLVALAALVPILAAGARRLHDTDKSGWWLLIGIIPLIGIVVLIVFFVMDSQPGTNQYGPSPKGGNNEYNQAPNANWGQN
jgi:uncharacterized membrane protein YhaH (DUF805 family)